MREELQARRAGDEQSESEDGGRASRGEKRTGRQTGVDSARSRGTVRLLPSAGVPAQ